MSSSQNKPIKLYGPWKGVSDADGDVIPSAFEVGYNVHSDGGEITCRGGRVPWSNEGRIPPLTCLKDLTDVWRVATDGDPDSTFLPGLVATTNYIEITSKVPIGGVSIGVKTPNTGAVTLVAKYNSDAAGTMSNLSYYVDSTLAAGKTLAQSGWVLWSAPSPWPKMNDGTYRIRLYVNTTGFYAGTALFSVLMYPVVNAGTRRVHPSRTGGIVLTGDGAAWIDYGSRPVGLLTDAEFTLGGKAKPVEIGRYGYCLDDLGRIVVLDEYAKTAKLLTSVPGSDATSQAYLTSLPAFVTLAAYNDRLFGVTDSGTVVYSDVTGSYVLPTDGSAPYGGVHLWPSNNNFDIGPSLSGYGAAVLGGYLYLLSSSRVYYFDENSLQQVPSGGGCLAPESVAVTPKGLIYLAPDGVRGLSGATSVLVSAGVSNTIAEQIPNGGFSPCVGVCVPSLHEYRLFIPVRESSVAQAALVWDYESGEWYMWGSQPVWNEQDGKYAVASAIVVQSVGGTERLITCAPGMFPVVHDVGESDFVTLADSYATPIESIVVFKTVGLGEDQGVATWRDVRIEAKCNGTKIRLAVLTDGVKFQEYFGSTPFQLSDTPYLATSLDLQALWSATLANDLELFTGSDSAAVPRWSSFRIGQAKKSRTAQIVLFNGRYLNDADHSPAIWNIRGVELEARQGRGRR